MVIGDDALAHVQYEYGKYFDKPLKVRVIQNASGMTRFVEDDPKFAEPWKDKTIYMVGSPYLLTEKQQEAINQKIKETEKGDITEALILGLQSMLSPVDGAGVSNRVFSIPANGRTKDSWAAGGGYLQIGVDPFTFDDVVKSGYSRADARGYSKQWLREAEQAAAPRSTISPVPPGVGPSPPGSNRPIQDAVYNTVMTPIHAAGNSIDTVRLIVDSEAQPRFSVAAVAHKEGRLTDEEFRNRVIGTQLSTAVMLGSTVVRIPLGPGGTPEVDAAVAANVERATTRFEARLGAAQSKAPAPNTAPTDAPASEVLSKFQEYQQSRTTAVKNELLGGNQPPLNINGKPVAVDSELFFKPNTGRPHGLPEWSADAAQQPTFGELVIDGQTFYIKSGETLPGKALKLDETIPTNAESWKHVEGQTAAIMQQSGVTKATLTINNPAGSCLPCRGNVPSLLPPGGELTVRFPDGMGGFTKTVIKANR